jgi:molybdopterin molybdotransferase
MKQNLSVEAALEIVLQQARPLQHIEQLPLTAAYGGILGADLSSKVNHPYTDDTAVDGYACLEADARNAGVGNPVKLKVIGQSPAGRPFTGQVGPGEAVQVFTGAPIPKGANAVVRVEDTLREGDFVWLLKPASAADIRRKGDDLVLGQTYLHKGSPLTPGRVGLAAAMGYATLPVVRRPRVGILSTGDEVVEPGEPLPYGGVYNSNSYSVAGLVLEAQSVG